MILREKKRLQAHQKIWKNGMVIFVYINAVNFYAFQPLNAHAHHNKRP